MVRQRADRCVVCPGSPHSRGDGPLLAVSWNARGAFSPLAWGWSELKRLAVLDQLVLPTRVGMVRCLPPNVPARARSPHSRGDGPTSTVIHARELLFSPLAWGWSEMGWPASWRARVLPTRVGMVRALGPGSLAAPGSPHSRGDGPELLLHQTLLLLFSPLAWGWSAVWRLLCHSLLVLPTRVGMVRASAQAMRIGGSSPHSRGDGPSQYSIVQPVGTFSPLAWGWSDESVHVLNEAPVLPTRVGMVRGHNVDCASTPGSPHSRGDGPSLRVRHRASPAFSPLAWGWSEIRRTGRRVSGVLPTRVGMVRSEGIRPRPLNHRPHRAYAGPVQPPSAMGRTELCRQ